MTEVPAGASRRIRLRASVAPATPAGSYPALLVVAGVTHPAELQVAAVPAVRVAPDEVVLTSGGGEQEAVVTVTNEGNLGIVLDDLGPVPLRPEATPERVVDRILVVPARGQLAVEPAVRRSPTAAVAAPAEEVGPLLVARPDSPVEVAPGRSARVVWRVALDDDLPPGVRHAAVVAVYDADLTFRVLPGGAASKPAEQATAAKTTAKRATAKKATAKKATAKKATAKKAAAKKGAPRARRAGGPDQG
jgi:hypothetical protein